MQDVGRGGWLSSNELIPYPFQDGQIAGMLVGGAYPPEFQRAIERCFCDATVAVDQYVEGNDEWPAIGNFVVFKDNPSLGPTFHFVVHYGKWDHNVHVYRNVPSISGEERWRDYTMVNMSGRFFTVSGKGEVGSFAVTLSTDAIKEMEDMWPDGDYYPPADPERSQGGPVQFLKLCPRCVSFRTSGLLSVDVFDGVGPMSEGPHFSVTGDVVLSPGNNMTFAKPQDGDAAPCAVPGAGMGRIPCECEDTPLASQQICSPDGHTRIFNDTCYDIVPSIETETDSSGNDERVGVLRINSKCTACCTCQMYESIVKDRLVPLYEAVKKAKADIDSALEAYEDGVARFNKRISEPAEDDISLSLTGTPIGRELGSRLSGTGVSGKMERCAFTAVARNSAFRKVRATLGYVTGTDKVVEVSASWTDENGVPQSKSSDLQWGMAGAEFVLSPGRSLIVTFVAVRDDMVGEAKADAEYSGSILMGFDYWDDEGEIKHITTLKRDVATFEEDEES